MIDPFSDEADPPPLDAALGRRELLRTLVILPALGACAHVQPACPTRPDTHSCSHRFCRYYGR